MDGRFLHAGLIAQDTWNAHCLGSMAKTANFPPCPEHMQPGNISGYSCRHPALRWFRYDRPAGIRGHFSITSWAMAWCSGFTLSTSVTAWLKTVTLPFTIPSILPQKTHGDAVSCGISNKDSQWMVVQCPHWRPILIFFTIFRMFHSYFFEVTFIDNYFRLFGSFVIINTRGEPFTLLRLCP